MLFLLGSTRLSPREPARLAKLEPSLLRALYASTVVVAEQNMIGSFRLTTHEAAKAFRLIDVDGSLQIRPLLDAHDSPLTSIPLLEASLLLAAMPFAPSSSLLLSVRPGASSSVLLPTRYKVGQITLPSFWKVERAFLVPDIPYPSFSE